MKPDIANFVDDLPARRSARRVEVLGNCCLAVGHHGLASEFLGVDERTQRSLYQRANGYSYDAVKIFMPAGREKPVYAPYVEHVPPDVTTWVEEHYSFCARRSSYSPCTA
jgi:hypothetical protein